MDDDSEQNTRYPQMRFPATNRHQPTYGSQSSRSLVPVRNQTHLRPVTFTRFKENYGEDEADDDEDGYEIEETGYGGVNGGRADFSRGGLEGEQCGNGNRIEFGGGGDELERNLKKRKMKRVMGYEDGGIANGGGSRELGARNGIREWSEHETFLLLEAWGDRYLQLGRKSLRSEDWKELAEKVSEASEIDRSDDECRNKMDTLKKRYRKEKAKTEQFGGQCKWACFKKMDMLLTMSPRQQCGLACGVDSGEYVFMNPRVYLNCANGLDEMRDSPGNSEDDGNDSDDAGDDDYVGIEGSASFRYLADSIKRFGEIYEKIENSKRQQMMELEKMRMDFQKEMELQKKQILDIAEAEIEKLRENDEDEDADGGGENVDDGDTDASAENISQGC